MRTMRVKKANPTELVVALVKRSQCAIQVAAVLTDRHGIFSWGWNHAGFNGLGQHAEAHCLSRANKGRVRGAILYVAAVRKRNNRILNARPCSACQALIKKVGAIIYRDGNGSWRELI